MPAGWASGCSTFGGSNPKVTVDPNAYPVNYQSQIVTLLRTTLTDRADFQGALISPPVLEQLPLGKEQHYVVCLQFNGHGKQKTRVVMFLDGRPDEYVDATGQECASPAYQPFTELAKAIPSR